MRKQTTFLKVRDFNLLKVRGLKIFIPLFRQNLPITHLLNVLHLQNIAVVGTRKSVFSRFENVFFLHQTICTQYSFGQYQSRQFDFQLLLFLSESSFFQLLLSCACKLNYIILQRLYYLPTILGPLEIAPSSICRFVQK